MAKTKADLENEVWVLEQEIESLRRFKNRWESLVNALENVMIDVAEDRIDLLKDD